MQPSSPDPKFDFMLKDNAPPARRLPHFSSHARIAIALAVGIILVVIIGSFLSGHKSGGIQTVIDAVARGQETLRVTSLAQKQLLRDQSTQAIAATVTTTLTSDQQQLVAYLTKNHTKLTKLQLAADADKSSDALLQAAAQNNGLDAAYLDYLKTSLAKYKTDLQAAYDASGPNGKAILKNSFESTNTLLSNPPLNS